MATSFGCSDFWDCLGGQALVMIGQWHSRQPLTNNMQRRQPLTNHMQRLSTRLQNSPYFCVFKYARAVTQKVWNEAENRERDWGEHTPYGRVRLARFARVRLLRHASPISFTDFEKKTDCFAVYLSTKIISEIVAPNACPHFPYSLWNGEFVNL